MTDMRTTIQAWRWKARGLGRELGMLSGNTVSFFKKARGHRVLVYHGVCKKNHLRYNTLFITAKTFERHLRLYKKYCHLLSLDDYFGGKFSNDRFNLCLTFDDGFCNNHTYVLPLLEKYEVPAAFFITGISKEGQDILWNDVLAIARRHGPPFITYRNTKFIKRKDGVYISAANERLNDVLRQHTEVDRQEVMNQLRSCKGQAYPDYWLQMSPWQIQAMAASPWVTIGSHGFYHNDLAVLDPDKAAKELFEARQYLRQMTGKEVAGVAFPYGSYNSTTIALAKQAGYTQLFAGDFLYPGDGADTTLRERFTINPFITPVNQLYANIKDDYA